MKSMLIIEGDHSLARLFAEIFSQHNWSVDAPCEGKEVLRALLGSDQYDIILVSNRVPALSGTEIVSLARELEHRKHTPVLMVTASYDVIGEAMAAGADEVLCKPFDMHSLIAAVMRHISEAKNEA